MIKKLKQKSPQTKKPRKVKPSYDNITFDSKLEVYCYKKLIEASIKFEYTSTTFILQHPFTYDKIVMEPDKKRGPLLSTRSSKYQSIKYTPDFIGDGWIIETKGVASDSFKLRWKMFKRCLVDKGIRFNLYLPKNQKQVDQCIELILNKNAINK